MARRTIKTSLACSYRGGELSVDYALNKLGEKRMTDKLTDKEFKEIADSVPTPKNMTEWEQDNKYHLNHILVDLFCGEITVAIAVDLINEHEKSEIKKALDETILSPVKYAYGQIGVNHNFVEILKDRGIE